MFDFLCSDASLDELVKHCLQALKGASQKKLTSRNVSVGFVGRDAEFRVLDGEDIRAYVAAVTQEDDEDEADDKDKAKAAAEEEKEAAEKKAKEDEEAAAEQQAQQNMQE